jgi:Gpi18-like mannosyltransferase
MWQRWDWERYLTIAEYGYTSGKGPAFDHNLVAFFPGFPLLVRAVHVVVPDWTVAGLLISLAAGAVAVVALARVTELEYRLRAGADGASRRAASTAVVLLVCAPAAQECRRAVHRTARREG